MWAGCLSSVTSSDASTLIGQAYGLCSNALVQREVFLEEPDFEDVAMTAQTRSEDKFLPLPRPHVQRWGLRGQLVRASLLGAVLVGVVAAIILLRSAPQRTYRIHMITDVTPLRVLLAEDLRAEGSLHHLDIVLESKHRGTLDALAEVDSPSDIKLAPIPGGITDREYPHLRMVTTVAREPLHLLVRAELAEKGISGLRGKRVDLGPRDTASHHLAREVLAFVGLVPSTPSGPGGYTLESSSPDDLYRELGRIESLTGPDHVRAVAALPDAVMFLAATPIAARQTVCPRMQI